MVTRPRRLTSMSRTTPIRLGQPPSTLHRSRISSRPRYPRSTCIAPIAKPVALSGIPKRHKRNHSRSHAKSHGQKVWACMTDC